MTKTHNKRIPVSCLKGDSTHSARYTEIGTVKKVDSHYYVLLDKICYEPHICPSCGSDQTFHHRIQNKHLNSKIDNVWRTQTELSSISRVYKKYEFCLNCHKEWLYEAFCWHKTEYKIGEL